VVNQHELAKSQKTPFFVRRKSLDRLGTLSASNGPESMKTNGFWTPASFPELVRIGRGEGLEGFLRTRRLRHGKGEKRFAMRRAMLLLSVVLLLAMTIGCRGGDSSTGTLGTTKVTITVDDSGGSASTTIEKNSLLAMAESLFMVITGSGIALAQIPPDVTHILFTVSAPDMVTITRDIPVAGRSSITETFTVPNGRNRCFSVQAQNASGDTLYRPIHQICRNLDGKSLTIRIDMQDYAPPTFEGLQFANPISATQIDLFWVPAYDYCTLEEDFVYQIYMMAETSGEQNFASPTYTTDPGAISFSVTGLQPGTDYFFVVRATDSNGNQDSNSIEILATTPDDTDPPFIVSVSPQDGSLDVPTNTVITVTFSEPIDPSSFASAFTLVEVVNGDPIYGPMTYSGTTVTLSPLGGLSSQSSYEATVTTGVTDLEGNNMQADYIWSFSTRDDQPPVFEFIPSSIDLICVGPIWRLYVEWSDSASDDITSSDNIQYLIYVSTSSGGQDYDDPSYIPDRGEPSSTFTQSDEQAQGRTYQGGDSLYLVVRAMDEAGNISTDIVQLPITVHVCP